MDIRHKKILANSLNKEGVSGESIVYKFDEKSYRECLKW